MGHAKSKIHGQIAWAEASASFFEKIKVPPKAALDEKDVLLLEKIEKPQLFQTKSLRFKDEERAEAEMLFDPGELEKDSKITKDGALSVLHMEMWLWLLDRDFDLKKIERIKLLSPTKLAQTCQELQSPDAAERFVDVVGTLAAELKGVKLVLCPVWGPNPDHWTLLIVRKSDEGTWTVLYKDSLSGFHKGCAENAQRLTTLLSSALMTDLTFPKERCNLKMQPKGSLECGFFVCHWVEESCREELKEGPFAIGLPNVGRVFERLQSCSNNIIKNKGWAAIHEAKATKAKDILEKKKDQKAKALAEVVKSKEFQEEVAKDARMKALIPWATLSGCPKCRWKVNGSTCCNPEKMQAKELSMKESSDGKFDKALYEKKLLEVYAKLKAAHTSPVAVTELPKKAGGQKDTNAWFEYGFHRFWHELGKILHSFA